MVTQDDQQLIFNYTIGKFKIPGFRWVSAFCYGLAQNLHLNQSENQTAVCMPEFLNNMVGCKSSLYHILEKIDITHEERDLRLCAIERAIPAWEMLPEIYLRLVVAKHIEAMIREGLIQRWALGTDTASIANLVANSHCGEDYVNGGAEYTLAVVDYPDGCDRGMRSV